MISLNFLFLKVINLVVEGLVDWSSKFTLPQGKLSCLYDFILFIIIQGPAGCQAL